MIKVTSIFNQPVRQLLGPRYSSQILENRKMFHRFSNANNLYPKEKKIALEYWKAKYKQILTLEKTRVLIDDKEYLIDSKDGFLSELI